jgi:hypothetical protein
MRSRSRVLQSLEGAYREAFESAQAREDQAEMARLELEFQRDQLQLEVLLDLRELLTSAEPEEKGPSLLERAQAIRRLTKLR